MAELRLLLRFTKDFNHTHTSSSRDYLTSHYGATSTPMSSTESSMTTDRQNHPASIPLNLQPTSSRRRGGLDYEVLTWNEGKRIEYFSAPRLWSNTRRTRTGPKSRFSAKRLRSFPLTTENKPAFVAFDENSGRRFGKSPVCQLNIFAIPSRAPAIATGISDRLLSGFGPLVRYCTSLTEHEGSSLLSICLGVWSGIAKDDSIFALKRFGPCQNLGAENQISPAFSSAHLKGPFFPAREDFFSLS